MAEEEGFEPRGFDTPVGFQDRSLQPDLGIPPYRQELIYHIILFEVNIFSKKIQFVFSA